MLLLMFSLDKQQCLPVRAVAWSGWHGFCSQAMIRLKFYTFCYHAVMFFRSLWCTCKYLKLRKIRDLCSVLGRYFIYIFFFVFFLCWITCLGVNFYWFFFLQEKNDFVSSCLMLHMYIYAPLVRSLRTGDWGAVTSMIKLFEINF